MAIYDSTDLLILAQLQSHGRMPIAELSKKVNLSPTPCAMRLRKLEKSGVIETYRAHLSPKAMQMALLVFVTVKLRSTDEATLRAFNTAIRPLPQVLECHMTGGGFDYLLKIRVRDMADYRQLLGGVIGSLEMVEGTHSYFVMEEVKETTLLPIPKKKDVPS
jgi:Lrp/AsnC family transcriptional regulator, leucine-responsive regulatory protein